MSTMNLVFAQKGNITVLVLVMLIVFGVILGASVRFIARQSRETSIEEQREQAFAAAEAGIHHVLWQLHPDGGGHDVDWLVDNSPLDEEVTSTGSGESLAQFSVSVDNPADSGVDIVSTGRDGSVGFLCQVISARVEQAPSGLPRVAYWSHRPSTSCSLTSAVPIKQEVSLGMSIEGQMLKDSSHRYRLHVSDGQRLAIRVKGTSFSPYVVVRDDSGVLLAEIGREAVLQHVQLASFAHQLRASLRAFTGRSDEVQTCSTVQDACLEIGSLSEGAYDIYVSNSSGEVNSGSYSLIIQ